MRAPTYAPAVPLDPARVQILVAELRDGSRSARLSKRSVEMPTAEEQRFSQGAAIYGCAQGHAWIVYLLRTFDNGFAPVDPGHLYCTNDPCSELDDAVALGEKLSGIRFWTLRR